MRSASPGLASLAHRLLRSRSQGDDSASQTAVNALHQSCEALRPQLTRIVGREGFRALLARALAVAKTEFPWLDVVQVDSVGSLAGLDEALSVPEPPDVEAGAAAVLMHFLRLLTTFVGSEVTRTFVAAAWPDTPIATADLATEEGEV